MSYESEIIDMAELGASKATGCRSHQIKYFIGGMQAGAYVGIAIILIMTLGAAAPEGFKGLIMGGTFGLALILVVIAYTDIFFKFHRFTTTCPCLLGWKRNAHAWGTCRFYTGSICQ